MLERECALHAMLLGLGRKLASDIDDAQFATQPAPGVNHPAWIFGHLALISDGTIRLLGEARVLPKAWSSLFAPGTNPSGDRSVYPSKDELLTAWSAAHDRIATAAAAASAELLAEPHGVTFADMNVLVPTKGELVAHVMTSHESFHLGQLSVWRRLAGMPYLF